MRTYLTRGTIGQRCICLIVFSVTVVMSASPQPFADEIAAFEAKDRDCPPPEGAIVAVGSSSMRGWHQKIQEDLSPLTVISRGFGGSTLKAVNMYLDRIVLPYKPRAILLYEGDNDIWRGAKPDQFMEQFQSFKHRVFEQNSQCRVYVISIKPSLSRWGVWPRMEEANALLEADCAKDERLTFLDVSKVMFGKDGKPKKEIFQSDKLHMTRDGDLAWLKVIKPVLMEKELQFEKSSETVPH